MTGANKGIGYAISHALAKNQNPPIHVILGSRDQSRGQEASKKLAAEGLSVSNVVLDIDDEVSISNAKTIIEQEFGGLDILVNNAGMAYKGDTFNEEVCRKTINTNYYGTQRVFDTFYSILNPGARVVNISSSSGTSALRNMSENNRRKFMNPNLTITELNNLMEQFITDVKNGDYKSKGWPKTGYGMSKAGETIMTRIHARDNKDKDIVINCCCPGWVRTDMAGSAAPLSPDEGAETPVKLALLPQSKQAPTGEFWRDGKKQSFV